jgi:hypothetical protein
MDLLKKVFHDFLSSPLDLDAAQQFLMTHSSLTLDGYDNNSVRKILSSLILYKFPNEEKDMFAESRKLILLVLRGEATPSHIEEYMNAFTQFKKKDFEKYIYELAGSTFNLQEIISKLDPQDPSYHQWKQNIELLLQKITTQVTKIKGLDLYKNFLQMFDQVKTQTVTNLMEEVFWRSIKDDLDQHTYDHVLKQLEEIKTLLIELHSDEDIEEGIDLNYVKQRLDHQDFTAPLFASIVSFCFTKIIRYGMPVYDKVMIETKDKLLALIQKDFSSDTIVTCLKTITQILLSLIVVVRTYREKIQKSK